MGANALLGFVFALLLMSDERITPGCVESLGALNASCPRMNAGFGDLGEALESFVYLGACQGLPERMLPSYSGARAYGVLWLGTYLCLNLLLLSRFNRCTFLGQRLGDLRRRFYQCGRRQAAT